MSNKDFAEDIIEEELSSDNDIVEEVPEDEEPEEPKAEAPEDGEPEEPKAEAPEDGEVDEKTKYLKSLLNKSRRERHHWENVAREAQQRAAYAENGFRLSTEAAEQHYTDNIDYKVEKAKFDYLKAVETGDVAEQAKATEALIDAKADAQYMLRFEAKKELFNRQQEEEQQYYQNPEAQYQQGIQYEINSWKQNNPQIDPHSPQYDAKISTAINAYAGQLESYMQQNGYGHKIHSREYFDMIDDQLANLYSQQGNRNLNMKPSNNVVNRVTRNHHSGKGEQLNLSPNERKLAEAIFKEFPEMDRKHHIASVMAYRKKGNV